MESTTTQGGSGAGRMGEPEEPHGHSEAMPHHKVPYYAIFAVLVVLTVITVVVARHRFENELINLLLAMLVASVKACCVALYFMHLKFEGKLIYLILIVPLILCVILCCALIPDIAHALPFNRLTPYPGVHQ
jgi:cytochrome c oxidase subunit 4